MGRREGNGHRQMLRVSYLHTWCVCVDSVELAACKAILHILVCSRHIGHLHPFILETTLFSVRLMGQVTWGKISEKVIRVAEQYLIWKYNKSAQQLRSDLWLLFACVCYDWLESKPTIDSWCNRCNWDDQIRYINVLRYAIIIHWCTIQYTTSPMV